MNPFVELEMRGGDRMWVRTSSIEIISHSYDNGGERIRVIHARNGHTLHIRDIPENMTKLMIGVQRDTPFNQS